MSRYHTSRTDDFCDCLSLSTLHVKGSPGCTLAVSAEDRAYREAIKSLVDEVEKVLAEDLAGGVLGMSDLRASMDAFREAAINWAVSES